MFEAVELHKKIPKEEFEKAVQELRSELLKAQYALKDTKSSVIVIISGVEGANKSEVVNRLNEWLDSRWIRNYAYWDESDEERLRPYQWRFWRNMPPRGSMAIMFGSWYTRPVVERALGTIDDAALDAEMMHIEQLERMLTDDGHVIVKFWFHLSKEMEKKRLKGKAKNRLTKLAKKFLKSYDDFADASSRAIRLTDTGNSPWHLIDAEDKRYAHLKAGRVLLQSLQNKLEEAKAGKPPAITKVKLPGLTQKTVLDSVDLEKTLSDEQYKKQLEKYQVRMSELCWKAREARRSVVAMFEGWDAAGKGGAIRRVTGALDARLYSVISVAAPTDEEKARHYLWRFWRHLPRDGYVTVYDRSWYGRVLVERVEGFCRPEEWMRAYQEINDFEEHLHRHGTILTKFWVHLSSEEQLRRFKEREQIAWKQHKITEEDWRNREKWGPYVAAIDEMVARTSTSFAPWTLVPGNDKKVARVTIVKTLCNRIEKALKS
ncbi:MAG: polyphosphate:AMP phosphotransferase [Gammaproteobacteria bacterium RIFCSPLOWO2_02_FULL_61_13]|nr:MAG: polyphosphate:AMP phosphotransferase [Gammaproteobacteria bacterium RIFCSPLOWO2_02_FULL_61_13]